MPSMSILKSKIKTTFLNVQKKYQKVFYGNCAVLLYHRVAHLENDPQLLAVSPENFDAHISLLKNKYTLITVDEFQFHLEHKKKFPENAVLITFDDGYADNFLEALPVLEKHKTQALFYISTGTLNTEKEFWWDAMERIILLSATQPSVDSFELNGSVYGLKDLNPEKRCRLYESLLPELRRMTSEKRDEKIVLLTSLFKSEEGRGTHRAMTFDQFKKMRMSKSAVIGAHTHLHPSLGALTYDEQFKEINTSKKIIEELTGEKVIHFSYPFGTNQDYNSDTLKIVKQLGFKTTAANYPAISHKHSDIFCFPRFLVRNWNTDEFGKNMKKFFS
jgi:peptidoglycan/xylan/chitin deacetylase (PgdA/CDA1 family)